MKETFYFSHDYNARSDEKIKRLIRTHGMLGYGIYWALVEDLYQNANELQMDSEGIAYDMRVDVKIVSSILQDFELFETNISYFSSKSVGERLAKREEKSAKARESAEARWGKKNANAKQTQSESNAIKERKGKENKGKKKEINIYRQFKHLTLTQEDFEKLEKDFSKENIDMTLDKIENYKKNTNYTSLYLTALNWLKLDSERKKDVPAAPKINKDNPKDFLEGL